jgi:hypothetical protein
VSSQEVIADVLTRDFVILRREHPELRDALDWQLKLGHLTALLPGVYAPPDAVLDPRVMVVAVARASADAVFARRTAASSSSWPELPLNVITVAARRERANRRGLAWERRGIPPELITVRNGLRLTTPLTALDLSDLNHTEALDVALRKRAAGPRDRWTDPRHRPEGVRIRSLASNALVQAQWRVLRFTYRMLVDYPDVFLASVHDALGR